MVELEISRLGAKGDGIADTPDGPVYVPGALPAERVEAEIEHPPRSKPKRWHRGRKQKRAASTGPRFASVSRVLQASKARINPPCSHFDSCGGCAAQHMSTDFYRGWKLDTVMTALGRHGLDAVDVAEPVSVPAAVRRRAGFAFRKTAGGVIAGFRARRSHRIVDIDSCPVLMPEAVTILRDLRTCLDGLLAAGDEAGADVLIAENGADVVLKMGSESPDLAAREALVALAQGAGLARLSWAGFTSEKQVSGEEIDAPELIYQREFPRLTVAEVAVNVPPLGFCQPSADGEAKLAACVLDGLEDATQVADLYAGWGAFSLRLAVAGKRVAAFDAAAGSIDALNGAARRSGLGPNVSASVRDLERQPLRPEEMADLDGLVLDPPRAGAAAQVALLAGSNLPVIVYVSCNAQTFARDASVLCAGGYQLGEIRLVDQFLWSHHVELVGVFSKGA